MVVQLGLAMMPFGGRERVVGVDLRDDQRDLRVHPPGRGVVHHDRAGGGDLGRGGQGGGLAVGEQGEVQAGEVGGVGVLDGDLGCPATSRVRPADRAEAKNRISVTGKATLRQQGAHHPADLTGGSENSYTHAAHSRT